MLRRRNEEGKPEARKQNFSHNFRLLPFSSTTKRFENTMMTKELKEGKNGSRQRKRKKERRESFENDCERFD